MSFHDAPDEECECGCGHQYGLYNEEVAAEEGRFMTDLARRNGCTYILCTGNQMSGSEMSQKRKKHRKSRVFVPEDAGIEFAVAQFSWI